MMNSKEYNEHAARCEQKANSGQPNDRDRVEEIKTALDIVEVIGKDVKLTSDGNGEYHGATSASSKSGASLKVSSSMQCFNNFATGEKGDVFDWIGHINGLDVRGKDFPEVLKIAADLAGVELAETTEEERNIAKERADIHNLFTEAAEIFHSKLTPELYNYIEEKWGVTRETVDQLRIGYAETGRNLKDLDTVSLKKSGLVYVNGGIMGGEVFQGRITFPYWKNGKVVYLIGRQTAETPKRKDDSEPPKYQKLLVNGERYNYVSTEVQNSYFYGEDRLRGADYCIITEGVADCIAMLQAGFPCISPVTVQFREKDHPKLISLTDGLQRVYICNDNESNHVGLKGALSTAEALESAEIETRIIELPKPDDVDKIDIADYMKEHSADDFKALMENATGYWNYILNARSPKNGKGTTVITRLGMLKMFISNDLHKMSDDVWRAFVENDVLPAFGLHKKDARATIDACEKNRKESHATDSNKEDCDAGEGDGGVEEEQNRWELPPIDVRLQAYPENVIHRANEILDNGDPFEYICDTWNERHVGDRDLGKMLACSVASTQVLNLAVGIHEKPSGDTESGKSDACTKMGALCPPWKFRSTTFSPKVLYYMPNLLPGTIIYTDDVDLEKPDVLSTVKKVTGEFEDPTVSDTIIDGKAVTMMIPPRINFWMSSVDTIGDKQLGTRFVYSNTEGGLEHDQEVNHKQRGKALGKPLEDDNEKILICQCMFEYICAQLHYVFSPYLFASTWSAESDKRNLEKFISVLFAVTVFKYRQRETLHDCLVGTLEDWERAISIYSPVAQNNSCLLSDEEILILYSIYEMQVAYDGDNDDGVPHKRLLNYMKAEGRYSKSDSTLKRTLIGDIGSGRKGFKEKVPGFSYETVSKPKLDDVGRDVKGSGYTKTLCYSYDGTLFDGMPENADIVKIIKEGIFVMCDNYAADGVEQLFREDPRKAHALKESTAAFEHWKQSLENQRESSEISEIIRNHQNSKPVNSELSSQLMPTNNNNNNNNTLRNHEIKNIGAAGISACVYDADAGEKKHAKTHAKIGGAFSGKNANFVNSEAHACDHADDFSDPILNSESTDSGHILNSEHGVMNSEISESADNDHGLNSETSEIKTPADSDLIGLLKRALKKFAWDEYHGTVQDVDEFVRIFNTRVPEYCKSLGRDAVGFNATKLQMRGWR